MPTLRWLWLALGTVLGASATVSAHPPLSTVGVIKVESDGRATVTLVHDVLAFALNDTSLNVTDPPMYELLHSPDDVLAESLEAAKERFRTLFVLNADGRRVDVELTEFPTVGALRQWQLDHPDRRLPVKMDIVARATLPPACRAVSFKFPEVLGDVVVTVDRPRMEPFSLPLRPGETSPEFDLRSDAGAPGDVRGGPEHGSGGSDASAMGWLAVFWRYVVLGFTHIIPDGTDHALFVLGLFLLSPRFKAVLWQITAFTVAHSITLFLTTFKVITMSSRIIEPTIAATIAFIAVENLFTTKVHAWRPVVAFIFGLVHGMGFASALAEVGLPTGQLVAGVIAFNVGVEGGHLLVLSLAFLALGWWRNRSWYRTRLAIPISLVIAGIALVWMVQRLIPPP